MKKTLTIFFLLLTPLTIFAQKKKSDAESEVLKGAVKTVVEEKAFFTDANGKLTEGSRDIRTTSSYDANGSLIKVERHYKGELKWRTIYFDLDGYRASKTEDFFESPGGGGPGRNCTPDARFGLKVKYEYDAKGNREKENVYDNCNELSSESVHKYDSKGYLLETNETVYFPTGGKPYEQKHKFTYKLDDKNNVIGIVKQDISPKFADQITSTEFSYNEFDAKDNWTKRTVKETYKSKSRNSERSWVEYRTITYY